MFSICTLPFLSKCVSCNVNRVDLVLFSSTFRLSIFLFIPSQLFEKIINSLTSSLFVFLNLVLGGALLLSFSPPCFSAFSTAGFDPGFRGENPVQCAYRYRLVALYSTFPDTYSTVAPDPVFGLSAASLASAMGCVPEPVPAASVLDPAVVPVSAAAHAPVAEHAAAPVGHPAATLGPAAVPVYVPELVPAASAVPVPAALAAAPVLPVGTPSLAASA